MKRRYLYNYFIIFSIFIFIGICLLSIYAASIYLSPTLSNIVFKQLLWYIIGSIVIIIILKLDNSFFYDNAWIFYILNIILLIGLLFVAPSINGSKCWYIVGGISIQPSELMKISLILVNARIINNYYKSRKRKNRKTEFNLLFLLLIVLVIPSILTFLEPDTGAVIVYFIITFITIYASGIKVYWLYFLLIIGILLTGVFLYLYFFQQEIFINLMGNSFFYRMDRIINWKSGSGMQLENSLVAIGSSGLWGHGFNKTPIYFPEAGTDFIFAVFTSNYGFVGSIIFIVFIIIFDIKLLIYCFKEKDFFNKFLILGTTSLFIYQQLQNISMTIGLMPIVGITLPFISYGGSSLITYMILIGLLLNATKKKRPIQS